MYMLVFRFLFLFQVLVQKRSPVGNQNAMRIILRPGDFLQASSSHNLTHQDIGSSLYSLPAIVGE